MVEFISTLGLQLMNVNNLTTGQSQLSKMSSQLTTGKYSQNLSDYSTSNAERLLNFNSKIDEQNGFLSVIQTLTPRIEMYDKTLNGIEDTASSAFSTLLANPTYNPETNAATKSQIEGFMDQMTYYLNQKLGDRYIYAGSRYGTAPVGDIKALPVPPTETAPYLATGNTLPLYDVNYDPLDPTATLPSAYTKDQVSIDTEKKLTYGINSNEDGFQQIIMGLRFAYAATQDQANYDDYMNKASTLLSQGLSSTRADHTDLTSANTTLNNTKSLIEGNVSSLQKQVSDIQNVDVNEVAVKITALQAQLEASYTVTGKIANLSIINYL